MVDGADVNYLSWGDSNRPGLVLIHGGAAHAQWWSHIAPLLSDLWYVVAPDMTGHGDSDHRDRYTLEQWSREVMAVINDSDMEDGPVVVGHSLGGLVTIQTGAWFGDKLAGIVIVDSPVRARDPESEEGARGSSFRSPGVYSDVASAMARFRLVPDQPNDNAYITEHVARTSLKETDEGWTWKFDPAFFQHTLVPMRDQLRQVSCRVGFFRGQHSAVVPPDLGDYIYETLDRNSPVISIPAAHHHLMFDQPIALVAALRTLLTDWDHSHPHHG